MIISLFVNFFIILEEIATKHMFKVYFISSYSQLKTEPFLQFHAPSLINMIIGY